MLSKGTIIRVNTKTKEDVFGECLYEIVETGLPAPEKERAGKMDGVKCVMLGGSGPSARKGFTVIDSEEAIQGNIASGITELVSPDERDKILAYYKDKKNDGSRRKVSGTGVVEMD